MTHQAPSAQQPTDNRQVPEATARLMRSATYASVGVALVLIVTKFAAWLSTDSVSLLSTLIDSLLDAAFMEQGADDAVILVNSARPASDFTPRFHRNISFRVPSEVMVDWNRSA